MGGAHTRSGHETVTTLLAKLLSPWLANAKAQPFQGAELPVFNPELPPDLFGGIHSGQDLRLFQWFNHELGPVCPTRDDLRSIQMRGDLWALDAGRQLASALSINTYAADIDIRDLAGFGFSRSDLPKFSTIEAMHCADGRPTPDTAAAVAALAGSVVDRHFGQLAIDLFPQQGRMWLGIEDGSHRMAAAITGARQLRIEVRVPAEIRAYTLDGDAIAAVERSHGIFVVAPGSHLAELRLHAQAGERFTLVKPRFNGDWPPPLLLTQRPAGRIPGMLGCMVDTLLDPGAAEPLSAFLRRHVPALTDSMTHACAPSPSDSP